MCYYLSVVVGIFILCCMKKNSLHIKVKHKPTNYVCLSVVTKGTSRSTGSNWATRPTCKALLWPWPNFHHYWRVPAAFDLSFMFDWALHSLLSMLNTSLCLLSLFKLIATLLQGIRKKDFDLFLAHLCFVILVLNLNKEWNYSNSLCHKLMNSYFYYAGCSRTHWAQRRPRRKWPSCKTRHQFQLITSFRSCCILFFGYSFYIFFHLSWTLSLSNRDHMGCQVLQDLMESLEKQWEYLEYLTVSTLKTPVSASYVKSMLCLMHYREEPIVTRFCVL